MASPFRVPQANQAYWTVPNYEELTISGIGSRVDSGVGEIPDRYSDLYVDASEVKGPHDKNVHKANSARS